MDRAAQTPGGASQCVDEVFRDPRGWLSRRQSAWRRSSPVSSSALALFGAQQLLFASDWPVSTLSGPYAECIAVMRAATASLSVDEQAWIWGQTARRTYGLTLRL